MSKRSERDRYDDNDDDDIKLRWLVAAYSFTTARALMTKAQVICARSKENISVFPFL